MMLEAFSPVILNNGVGNVEIYHASLQDFMDDPLRSKQYHIDAANAHEHLACCCLDFITRQDSNRTRAILVSSLSYPYPYKMWHIHLYLAYPSRKLRKLLAHFTNTTLRDWVQTSDPKDSYLAHTVQGARKTCLSLVVILNMLNYQGRVLIMNFSELDQGSVGHCGCI
jgi:hypothetical protein